MHEHGRRVTLIEPVEAGLPALNHEDGRPSTVLALDARGGGAG
jgi:hypothetical protein